MTITLPLPDAILSPNARAHWARKSKVTKRHRIRARMATLSQLPPPPRPAFSRYVLVFHWPDRRQRDDDNAAASCKAYRDGIADALGIDDHGLRMAAAPEMHHDKENPRLTITLLP